MIKKKVDFGEKNIRDTQVTDNSFTQAVKKAASGVGNPKNKKAEDKEDEEDQENVSKAKDELMRAKEAKNDNSIESEKFRRDED